MSLNTINSIPKITSGLSRVVLVISLLICTTAHADNISEHSIDPNTGLAIADGWELVRGHCGACHSYQLVTSNRGNRDRWLASIRWMQKKHNLWPFDEHTENRILDYLAQQYPAPAASRRKNLVPSLLP